MLDEQGFAGDEELKEWLEKAQEFVKTLGSK
jgi:hypothetical protein